MATKMKPKMTRSGVGVWRPLSKKERRELGRVVSVTVKRAVDKSLRRNREALRELEKH